MTGQHGYAATLERVRFALAGGPGEPVCGITFIAGEAVRALRWGRSDDEPVVTTVCSRLAPDFAFVESRALDARAACRSVVECGTVPFWVVDGPLGAVAGTRGWSETLMQTIASPDELRPALDTAVEAAISSIRDGVACGAGAVVVADDLAGAHGPLVSPDFALAELMPRLGRIAAAAAAQGLPAVWHSDGDTRVLVEAAAREGFAGLHPGGLGPEPFRQLFGRARRAGLVVLGGIHGWALRAGTVSAVRAATSAALVARSGGLLVCDDGGVSTGEELGALVSALQAVRTPR